MANDPASSASAKRRRSGALDYFLVSCPKDLAMYSDAVKTVGADFEVADLTVLIEHAMAQSEPAGAAAR